MKKITMVVVVLFLSMITVAASAGTFTQADLTGTWRMNVLKKGYKSNGTTLKNEWMRAMYSINSSGVVSCLDMADSTGVTTCPDPFALTLTMNETTGVITQSGANANADGHMTMTLNKNLMAGTETGSAGHSYHLMIAQKVTGASYSTTDVQSKSYVYHQLNIGLTRNEWEYGAGTSDSAGLLTISSGLNSSQGSVTPGSTGCTLSVNSTTGVVTSTGGSCGSATTFQGFLSDDKKTIVGTLAGPGDNVQALLIIQITGQTYTAGFSPAGTSATHSLIVGSGGAAGWEHDTKTTDSSGGMTFSDWVDSHSGTAPVGTFTGYITSSGTVTIDGNPTYHGQASHDGNFVVGTSTPGTGVYSLHVTTKVTPSDTTPNAFTFTDRTNVALNTEFKSNAITVAGINTATPISVSGGTYSINGGTYTSVSSTVTYGNTVKVRKVSAAAYSTTKSATLTIGGVSDTFSVTTMADPVDTTPDPFTFTDRTDVALSTEYKSNAITVSGINTASPISVTGGTYSINGGTYTSASGSASLGNTVKVRKVSAATYSTTKSATLTIGGVSDTFSVTTMAETY